MNIRHQESIEQDETCPIDCGLSTSSQSDLNIVLIGDMTIERETLNASVDRNRYSKSKQSLFETNIPRTVAL